MPRGSPLQEGPFIVAGRGRAFGMIDAPANERLRWLALTILTIARVSLGFQFQSIAVLFPWLRHDFSLSYADLGVLMGLYMFPGILLAIVGGLLGRRFGDKRMVCIGLVLMTLGGILIGLADSYTVILCGRLVAGIGAILLAVLMSKMVTDWFADREVVLAMAIFVNSFPIGIGIALAALGQAGEWYGWRTAECMTSAFTLICLLLVFAFCPRHPNDSSFSMPTARAGFPSSREIVLVCVAGAIWGVYNGTHSITLSFTPILLASAGIPIATAGFLLGLSNWLVVFSVLVGGVVAQRWKRMNLIMLASSAVWALCLLALPSLRSLEPLLVIGLVQGLPVGIILSLPLTVLRPQVRATGMGLFFTWLYVGHAALPPISGKLQDLTRDTSTSLYFAAALGLVMIGLFGLFRLLQKQALPQTGTASAS
jgi:predicted MFS family arabinose efflux permease